MSESENKLRAIADQLKNGVSPDRVGVQTFLGWFGVARRRWRVVASIRSSLAKHGIVTEPDFEEAYIYGSLTFAKAPNGALAQAIDPTVRLSRLNAANRPPEYVAPDSTLQLAISQMIEKDFSQLPVMTGPRDLKGIVSWKSIGARLALGRKCTLVKECMEPAKVLALETSLFDALEIFATEDCILVQANDRNICGIVTGQDLNDQFRLLAEPFLLVGEVEMGLRSALDGRYSQKELEQAKAPGDDREIAGLEDLTLGEYVRLVQDPTRWKKLSLAVDKATFVAGLERVRSIRNDIMHFSSDGLEPADMSALRGFADYMRRLRDLGAM